MSGSALDPIAAAFKSYTPAQLQTMDVAQWFATETMEVEVGESAGRPSQEVKLSRDVVTYLLANGWYITDYMASKEGGEWTSTAHGEAHLFSSNTSNTNSASENTPQGTKTLTARKLGEDDSTISIVPVPSRSTVTGNATSSTTGESSTTSTNGGAPYWYSCFKVRLQRRRIQAESVLQDMVRSFTDAYNEGRQVNSERYDELVSLYALMLSRTEGEANDAPVAAIDVESFKGLNDAVKDAVRARLKTAGDLLDGLSAEDLEKVREQLGLAIGDFKAMYDEAKAAVDGARKLAVDDFKAMYDEAKAAIDGVKVLSPEELKRLVDEALASIRAALAKFAESVDGLPEGWLESRTAEINRQFDAKIAQARSQMVTAGTYNGTVWPSVESGFERDRAYALNDLVDEIARIKVDVYGKIATITADAEARALDAPLKLADIERSLADLETTVLNAGMKLADIQDGLADTGVKMFNAGAKLADIQDGLAKLELGIADEKVKFADESVRIANAEAQLADVDMKLLAEEQRVADLINKQVLGKTELRNTVFKWMLDFMERRDDDHPSLEALVNASEKLGFAEGAPAANIS